jgi:FkbM family methyltransferase
MAVDMLSTLAAIVPRVAGKLGYTITPTWKLDDLPLENHVRNVIRQFSIDTVFDVGANAGQFGRLLRERVKFDGNIHSFEPVARLASKLAERVTADPHWHVHQYALGSATSRLDINVAASDTFSSFLETAVEEDSRFASSLATERRETVAVRRLDDVWGEMCGRPERAYLKVDTQGFDLEVLRGAETLLRRISALQFELSIQALYKGSPSYLDVLQYLRERGFELSALFPVSFDAGLRAIECDCVMVASQGRP